MVAVALHHQPRQYCTADQNSTALPNLEGITEPAGCTGGGGGGRGGT